MQGSVEGGQTGVSPALLSLIHRVSFAAAALNRALPIIPIVTHLHQFRIPSKTWDRAPETILRDIKRTIAPFNRYPLLVNGYSIRISRASHISPLRYGGSIN